MPSAELENSSPTQIKAKAARKPHAPKVGAVQPVGNHKMALTQVPLNQVVGLDPEIERFFKEQDFNFKTVTDFSIWTAEAAKWSYLIAPMVLIQRSNCWHVLGTGRAWRVAQAVFDTDATIPALVLTEAKRISTQAKFQIVAAELFGLCAEYRTRPNLPANLMKLWKAMNSRGAATILGNNNKAFAQGTGFSLRALTLCTSPQNKPAALDQATSDSGHNSLTETL